MAARGGLRARTDLGILNPDRLASVAPYLGAVTIIVILTAAGTNAKQISGLGDKAFSSVLGLKVLFGNVSMTVSNLESDDASAALIRALQPKL